MRTQNYRDDSRSCTYQKGTVGSEAASKSDNANRIGFRGEDYSLRIDETAIIYSNFLSFPSRSEYFSGSVGKSAMECPSRNRNGFIN